MNTLAERLRYAMEVLPPKKIKGVDLARAVGVKPPSVSDWLSGKSKTMEGENLLKASKFLGVNPNWLATGNGSPTNNNIEDDQLSNVIFRDLNLHKIPILDFVQAGFWHEVVYDGTTPHSYTYTDYISSNPEAIFSVIVQGNSMEPDFKEGDMLIVDASIAPKPGSYVIAQNGSHEATFKKYRVLSHDEYGRDIFELIPLNKDFPILSSITHEIRIIGVVVRHMRDFK
ncbi:MULTISPECIES: LexA family protein [Acinetobacter]|uniref:Helix-turn-helix domain-containing protein n=7 Tax=Acinetobacter baumannii TaxID=470 RepID=A0A5R9HPJ1_ACIBA|nr:MULTISPECIES: XRE family transcriptional regulator [Acinetobacter]ALJ88711.1 putative prophage transcriptional repressor [Acinetobacter baumannii]EGJ59828.1 peptidase S24-like protein [Acinetobacter baumannii 6013150]EGJ63290.1 peptidase S24-like protein [Acinetobacter baumannii 6013113]EHU1266386.1 LexA family transcriptional regulator [Acinetobacter baumannii]EHU1293942.1 LexA family transcriptional regulator [Acinetobacter baumannii]